MGIPSWIAYITGSQSFMEGFLPCCLRLNALPHVRYVNGFSRVCDRTCFARCFCFVEWLGAPRAGENRFSYANIEIKAEHITLTIIYYINYHHSFLGTSDLNPRPVLTAGCDFNLSSHTWTLGKSVSKSIASPATHGTTSNQGTNTISA